ncbi:MAG: hypothetical protein A2117_01865 [Candidatus Wildermuthbacteria bacterium GWA2_46_15]|uniref:Uncharacterized protein n=1 Tax=Candidatus Wildermuthbacteria bacterium GWA2_46_15 TaxID=1802443 RepID=A0A1G2QQ23_9BACT|nr:MAG: hypothetical protein A2117_01865 [Candidatus Wildermuthbacteria bacterium GWA2_46_15]
MSLQIEKTNKHERYFFDTPVFRCGKERWNLEQEDQKRKFVQNIVGKNKEIAKHEIDFVEKYFRTKRASYFYGEMVGMIRLYALSQQIRGELFFVEQRISKSLKNKKWKYFGKLFEFMIFETFTNRIIFGLILKRLREENQKDLLKNRFIDIEAFDHSGKYIDYLRIANFHETL